MRASSNAGEQKAAGAASSVCGVDVVGYFAAKYISIRVQSAVRSAYAKHILAQTKPFGGVRFGGRGGTNVDMIRMRRARNLFAIP